MNLQMIFWEPWIIVFFLKIVYGTKYLVNTTGCKIQDFNLTFFDDTLLPKKLTSCGERYVSIQKVAVDKIRFLFTENLEFCCYSYVDRSKDRYYESVRITFSPCVNFKNETIDDLKGEMIAVHCNRFGSYIDYYAIVKKNITVKKASQHTYNVLLLGIDTMSRKRVHNSMKETVNFLKKNKWLDFRGYNKIASNTKPNITPLLTGKLMQRESFLYYCYVNTSSSACNDLFLWSRYRKKGYATAFVEDSTSYEESLFPDLFKTTTLPPTEHYIGQIFKPGRQNNSTSCSGKLSCGDQILNYALDFAETYKENKFFGFFWITTQSHDLTHSPMSFDESVAKFFVNLKKSGVLDNTFVIFLSDHGIRFGKTRYQIEAYHDERLPMLFMHVPGKFKRNHKHEYTNLKLNKRRLISPLDLYLTLRNIMNLNREPKKIRACKNCKSLFQRISENRRCVDAGIDDLYCTCFELNVTALREIGVPTAVKKASGFVEKFLMNIPIKSNKLCQDNCLIKVLRINTFDSNITTKYYIVAFSRVVKPDVLYEVVVRRFSESTVLRYDVISDQSISIYGYKGDCVSDYGKPFVYACSCINNVNSVPT